MKRKRKTPGIRNWTAVSAWNRQAGAHGGTTRDKNRRDRKQARQELRRP